jgi:hypothetical protein
MMSSDEFHVFINNFSVTLHRPVSRCTRLNARVVPGFGSVSEKVFLTEIALLVKAVSKTGDRTGGRRAAEKPS